VVSSKEQERKNKEKVQSSNLAVKCEGPGAVSVNSIKGQILCSVDTQFLFKYRKLLLNF
jgi:hypothetical protein